MNMSTQPINEPDQTPQLRVNRRKIREEIGDRTISRMEIRGLVDLYYQIQEFRKEGANQVGAYRRTGEQPVSDVSKQVQKGMLHLEGYIKGHLDVYTEQQAVSRWAKSIIGIGPVIAAGLWAHIDIEKAQTAGAIWRFAGQNPQEKWEPKTKRPWNARLKALCWLIGESFVKVSAHPEDIYGKLWLSRKPLEWKRNKEGAFADQCPAGLARLKKDRDSEAKYWYSGCLTLDHVTEYEDAEQRLGIVKKLAGPPGSGIPMLPPAHIHARAKKVAVKLFLSHWHWVAYEDRFGIPPPMPYVLEHLGHTHFMRPPNWPMGTANK